MPLNKFRGDALPLAKVIRLLSPGTAGVVDIEISCGPRLFKFSSWNPSTIATTLQNSAAPEFANLTFGVSGSDVLVSGTEDEDFQISMAIRPAVTVANDLGATPVNQITLLTFNGARAGTYKLTINGVQTSAITYGDAAGLLSAIDTATGKSSSATIRTATADQTLLEWQGDFAATPVAVVMGATTLQNGTVVNVRESTPYKAGPHDVWMLGVEANSTFTLTIDGNSAAVRSDDGIDKMRQIVKTLSTNAVEVYGGFFKDGSGIPSSHYILDFTGYTSAARPTISISSVVGFTALKNLNDPTAQLSVTTAFGTGNSSSGYAAHYLLDFTTGNTITLEYQGKRTTITNSGSTVQPYFSDTTGNAAYATAAAAAAASLNDISDFSDFLGIVGKHIGNTESWGAASYAPYSFYHPQIIHLIDNAAFLTGAAIDGTLRQVGGTGTLRKINDAGSTASGAVHAISLPAKTSSGSFRLTLPEGTTAAIAYNASAATVEAQFDSLIGSGTSVTGSGTETSPWLVTYATSQKTRPLPVPTSVALGGNGTGSAGIYRYSVTARTQKATIAVGRSAVSGGFYLAFDGQGPIYVPVGTSAASLRTLLATLPGIGNVDNVVVTYSADSTSYLITFTSGLANQLLPTFLITQNAIDASTLNTVALVQRATGPRNWADATNWTLGRLPGATDDVTIDNAAGDIRYGLRQWVPVTVETIYTPLPTTTTSSTTTTTAAPIGALNRLRAIGGHDFRTGQIVRLQSTGTIPGGLSAGTNYYVLDADNEAGTFQLSATATGSPITITSAGSGTIYCGLQVTSFRIAAAYTAQLGRPERTNVQNSVEYLPRYLSIGVPSGTAAEIGLGLGRGSSLIRLDLGISAGTLRVVRTASSDETDKAACCALVNNTNAAAEVITGELGLAAFDGESVTLGSLEQNNGLVVGGAVALTTLTKNAGRLLMRQLTAAGVVTIRG
jgi:hypothetical protein